MEKIILRKLKHFLFLCFIIFFASKSIAEEFPFNIPKEKNQQNKNISSSQMTGGYNLFSGIDTKGWDVSITGKFLFWQAIEDYMDLAYVNNDVISTSPRHKKYYKMEFDYHPGFKVGIGKKFDYDNWGIFAEYTWFHMQNSASYNIAECNEVLCFRMFGAEDVSYTTATWHLDMDILDGEIERIYYVGEKLFFRSHGGIKGGWIDQKYHQKATAYNDTDDVIFYPTYIAKSKNWMIGPKAGIDTQWLLGKNFLFLGNLAASILYTHYNISQIDTNIYDENSNDLYTLTRAAKRNRLRPILDIIGGFSWGKYFGKDFYHIDLAVTYDFSMFWEQEMTYSDTIYGDLYIHGLTATMRFDF